jgi:hypothetical protein
MKRPKELKGWDFVDTTTIRDGYDLKDIPRMSDENFRLLIDEYNNLAEVVNALLEALKPTGIVLLNRRR